MTQGNPIDSAALMERVIRRDRRRMWGLGIACVVLWMAVVMLPWGTVLPMLAKVVEHQRAAGAPASVSNGAAQAEQQRLELLQIVKKGTIATFIFSVGSMFAAAVCTVSLVVLSRRATMRQVNARLSEISMQLKRLAEGS